MSHTLREQHLTRAAVANSKIVKLRQVGPDEILLTGMRIGTTMVRMWNSKGNETAHIIRVVEAQVARQLQSALSEGVIKVGMEFMELDLASARDLGIQWPESVGLTAAAQFQGSISTSGLNYSASTLSTKAVLNFLMREGFAKTLANPELFVRVGELATFHSGGEIPIPTGSQSYGNFYKKIEWKPFGLSIHVRPWSEDGHRILSDVKLDISEISHETAIDGVPGINRRKLETKMEALDGSTVVLSTLVKQTSSDGQQGIPILSSIPILGYLFSTKRNRNEEMQLIIAMTFSFLDTTREQSRFEQFRQRFYD